MNLDLLEVYVQVVDSGSLRAASKVVGIAPTLVSRRLKALESELGVTLIQRTTRRLSVTDEGKAFYRRARRVLDELAAARQELRPEPERVRGTVRAVLPTIAVGMGLMRRVGELHARHPELKLQLSLTDQHVDLVAGGWDVSVGLGPSSDSSHVARRLCKVNAVMAATPEYLARRGIPREPEDLSSHDCLRFISDLPQETWTLLDARGETVQVPVAGWLECDNSAVLYQAMLDGLGVGVAVRGQVAREAERGALVGVLPEYHLFGASLYALMPAGRHRLPRVRALVDWLAEFFKGMEA